MITLLLVLPVLFLAYANGANDNFKGVATLFGSGTTDFKRALWWATASTLAGSICSIFLAGELLRRFTGVGLVPQNIAADPAFLVAVAFGAAMTVMLATLAGFPISTTHGLVGSLIGAGYIAAGSHVNIEELSVTFVAPLIASPIAAVVLGSSTYWVMRRLTRPFSIRWDDCACIGRTYPAILPNAAGTVVSHSALTLNIASVENCQQKYASGAGITGRQFLDGAHYLSTAIVSFARGLNDTPKMFALLLGVQAVDLHRGVAIIALFIAIGGILHCRSVAETMSRRITEITPAQGLTANISTAILVIAASRYGLPVSTTHVSVGSIFGIGLVNKNANRTVVKQIVLSWILTLPCAAMFAGTIYFCFMNH